jgi:hypothetical protein
MGIEPTLVAWEATVLPLNYTRRSIGFYSACSTNINYPAARSQADLPGTGAESPFGESREGRAIVELLRSLNRSGNAV